MDKNEEKAYEDGFVAGMQHDAESRVSKFIDASMREWVSLTDEEVLLIYRDQSNQDFQMRLDPFKLYAAFEAKLKDKNNG